MTLLNPLALVFAVLAPLIVLLYLLKLRRRPAQVSTLLFWQRVTADTRHRAFFQRLRHLLSLLLQLLIFSLLLFALARPDFRGLHGRAGDVSTVVVLDARARMQARLGSGTAFDAARQIAAGYGRRASVQNPVALVVADGAPRVLVGLTDRDKSFQTALTATRPTDAGGQLEDAVALAAQLLATRPGTHRIVAVTDQEFPSSPMPTGTLLETRTVVPATPPRENVGIVQFAARRLPDSPETDEIFLELRNDGVKPQTGKVEISYEGRLFDVRPYALAPGERHTEIYPALATRSGLANARGWLTAHLSPDDPAADSLALDNDAYQVVPPARPARVLLVTRGNWFLESLLKADDQISFDQLGPDVFQPGLTAGFDAVIFDDDLPPAFTSLASLPMGNFLFLKQAPLPLADPPNLVHPLLTDLDATSPLLRQVNLNDVTVLRATAWNLPEPTHQPDDWAWASPVRSLEHPLVLTGERPAVNGGGRQRLVAVAFGASDSDLPLRVAFPLLVRNTLRWLGSREDAAAAPDTIKAGGPVVLSAGETLWTRPQRAFAPLLPLPVAEIQRGPGVFQPMHDGFYLLTRADGSTRWLAVNTSDPTMSQVNAPAVPRASASVARSVPAQDWERLFAWPPWVYLAAAAFIFCALEWWGFHRRRTE